MDQAPGSRTHGDPMTIDYDSLERMHKQEPWTADQQRHFEHGWEAGQRALAKAILNAKEEQMMDLLTYANPVFEKPDPTPPFFPVTIENAVQWLHADLDPVEHEAILNSLPIAWHHSLGRYIRNRLKLWEGNLALRVDAERFFTGVKVVEVPQDRSKTIVKDEGVTHLIDGLLHPDCVSHIIVQQLQEHLRKLKETKS